MSTAMSLPYRLMRSASTFMVSALAWVVTGVRPIWNGARPAGQQRIYFANHASHGDFILLAACLPHEERLRTKAVAAADYWGKTALRRFISVDLLSSLLISRTRGEGEADPVKTMLAALDQGFSLIIFPEGTRNVTDGPVQKFRSGLYNLSMARPDVELIPCFIENMSRVLPKGHFLPVPLLCRVVFGEQIAIAYGEERHAFLDRARAALLALDPRPRRERTMP